MLKPDVKHKKLSEMGRSMKVGPNGLADETIKGTAAVKQWADLMLRQRPGLTPVYNYDNASVGVDSVGVTSLPKAIAYAEIQRYVAETMKLLPCAGSVSGFRFTRVKGGLRIDFVLNLDDGQEVMLEYDL